MLVAIEGEFIMPGLFIGAIVFFLIMITIASIIPFMLIKEESDD